MSIMNSNVSLVRNVLKYTFVLLPIVAGLDNYTNILNNWSHYVSKDIAAMLPFEPSTFMMIVGVIEIAAGILVLVNTKIGAYVISAWLVAIALSLIFSWTYMDVAVRDLVMAISAFSLAKLSDSNPIKSNK